MRAGSDKNSEIVLSVSEYLERLNLALGAETGFVQGEVTEFKVGAKWVGFTLKDSGNSNLVVSPPSGGQAAILKCVMHAHIFRRLGVALEDGMEVKVYGVPRVSKGWGSLGFWVESIEPVGEGSLKKAFQLLLKKLEAEGLFARKRPFPEFISRVGVISSREGVVLQDLRKNLRRLNLRVSFMHAQVEGAGAVPGILRALEYFAKSYDDYDCVVIIRGGGSLESLQAFNNEKVARAVYAMPIPIIAGIGHDVDAPITALVADRDGSTPTVVAYIINSTWDRLTTGLSVMERELLANMDMAIYRCKDDMNRRFLGMTKFIERLKSSYERFYAGLLRGIACIDNELARARDVLLRVNKLLTLANPLRNLKLGYSLTSNNKGRVLRSAKQVKKGDRIETRLASCSIKSEVIIV